MTVKIGPEFQGQNVPEDYPYVYMWEKMMGAYDPYINRMLDQAREDKAPADAVYKNKDTWVTTESVLSKRTRRRMGLTERDPSFASVRLYHDDGTAYMWDLEEHEHDSVWKFLTDRFGKPDRFIDL